MVLVKGDWDLVEGPSGSAPSNTALSESAAALEARAEEIGRDLARDPALRRRAGFGADETEDETEDETAALRRQCEAMQREIDELKAARARERETADREAFADYAPPPQPNPPRDAALAFSPTLDPPLVSAYATHTGSEPDFTNFAYTKPMGAERPAFVETLDYVFLSPGHWKVTGVKDLKPKAGLDLARPYPTADEPSDHVLLAADLEVA